MVYFCMRLSGGLGAPSAHADVEDKTRANAVNSCGVFMGSPEANKLFMSEHLKANSRDYAIYG